MKYTVVGMLAHVDAGKTTLSESLLYQSKTIRKWGRVDHGSTFFDYDQQERKRGITIFAKQARLKWKDTLIQLLDTPGHVDFSAEMERTLVVLDYAVVIISALDGVQAHTETIWKLLKHYQVPTFLFINKMDITYASKAQLLQEIKTKLGDACVDFTDMDDAFYEQAALCEEALLEEYAQTLYISDASLQKAIMERKLFPCFFGAALKQQGVVAFLDALDRFTIQKTYPDTFGAKVYQITHDEQGSILAHVKITGGILRAKQVLGNKEKIDQLRRYQGNDFQIVQEAKAGEIITLKGVRHLYAGAALGYEKTEKPMLAAYLNYVVEPLQQVDLFQLHRQLTELAKEDPQLHVTLKDGTLFIRLMGEIQIEVIRQLIEARYGVSVALRADKVAYMETIRTAAEGVGHFEPLRHYAEVHLLLEPLPQGSGVEVRSVCPYDELAKNWQRLILDHLETTQFPGVLCGMPLTDVRITLLSGKAHLKHTESNDFKEACNRALRQALMKVESVLLEPYYAYEMEVPSALVAKAIYDVEAMQGTFALVSDNGESAVLSGRAPVAKLHGYQGKLHAYSKGKGKLFCSFACFAPCENAEALITQIGYDPQKDSAFPCGSIFCKHGAGFYVPWDEVEHYMHLPYQYQKKEAVLSPITHETSKRTYGEEELEAIFQRTYRTKAKENKKAFRKTEKMNKETTAKQPSERCLLVDGYNLIFSWPQLQQMAKDNMEGARKRLIDMMGNYQGYHGGLLILVFDAYQVERSQPMMHKDGDIYVAYTKYAQSADQYIEQATHELASNYQVRVATSDGAVQLISMSQGAQRISAREFLKEVEETGAFLLKAHQQQNTYHFAQPLAALRKQDHDAERSEKEDEQNTS